ncbi:MBL fold metallo-hydrolase [Herbiconiux sp. P17]|uniref:MBL fold metallo-hydrolase n=1 Tax=Herbiconiux wuyangfengii TaxID=3342794 RepID=UPI0035BB0E2B
MSLVTPDHYGPSVNALTRPAGDHPGLRLWWLGQAGFALEAGGQRILIDPYLSNSLAAKYQGTIFPHERLHPAPVEPERLVGIGAVLHTHAHTDHLDPWTIRGLLLENRPTFVAPRARRSVALERGIPVELLTGLADGESAHPVGGVIVEALPAAHESLQTDASGDHLCLGYIVTIGGVRLYHSGDCVPYEGLAERLRDARVDLALLPINGRDSYRTSNGVPGNFTASEAIALTRDAGIPALLGHHFGLFDFNTVDPADARETFTREAHDLEWTLPSAGLTYRVSRPTVTPHTVATNGARHV